MRRRGVGVRMIFSQRLNFTSALLRVAAEDATVHQVMSEVSHLVKPSSALRDPQIVSRLAALMAASAGVNPSPPPCRTP